MQIYQLKCSTFLFPGYEDAGNKKDLCDKRVNQIDRLGMLIRNTATILTLSAHWRDPLRVGAWCEVLLAI